MLFEKSEKFIRSASLEGLSETEAKVQVQTLVDEIVQVPKDIVLVFLPESDHGKDDNVGVPRPLRLKVREEGVSVNIKTLVNTTLKLTLLHHSSLKDPRLPVPVFGSDRIAYRRLQGIYPGELEGYKQYWL